MSKPEARSIGLTGASWETALGGYRLVFGPNALERVGELTRDLGGRRPLVVTDPRLDEAGHAGRTLSLLRRESLEPVVYRDIDENPTTRHVEGGVVVARAHRADCIVGLGGGSVLDCAKGINFLLTNGGRMEDYWGTGKASRPMLPSLGIPTTAGTGSEAQSYALICQEETHVKMACGDPKAMFRAVILDPELAATMPASVAGTAGIDALSHAVESFVCTRRNPISQMFSREAWSRLHTALPAALADAGDREAWAGMLLGAHLAGAAIEHSMLGAAHACANPLTARFPIAHGAAVGLMLPHVIRFNAVLVGALYAELQGAGASASIEDRFRELRSMAGLPERLRDCGVPRDCLEELATDAAGQWTAGFNPRSVTRVELGELYESAY